MTCSIIGVDDFGNNIINKFIKFEKSRYKILDYEQRLDRIQFIKTIEDTDGIKLNKKIWDKELKPLIIIIGEQDNSISKKIKLEYEKNEYVGIIEIYTQNVKSNNIKFITKDINKIINLISVIIFQHGNIDYDWGYVIQEEKIIDKNIKIYKLQGNMQEIEQQIKLLQIKEGACITNIFGGNTINNYTCKRINEMILKQTTHKKHNIYKLNNCNIENIEVIIVNIS